MSFTPESTGGKYKETLTVSQMPSHSHLGAVQHSDGATSTEYANTNYVAGTGRYRQIMSNTGGDQAHNNISPYIVVYFWKRTS